ncbi:hypothetical protein HY464_00665 [Candidatus Peregrinibacteria bacterium]|nr:hypothetical protein [Candidatus Peregrinibacteria bacterium]
MHVSLQYPHLLYESLCSFCPSLSKNQLISGLVPGNSVPLDRNDPLYTWEKYDGADATSALLYSPQEFSQNHQGKSKFDLLSSSPSGFQVFLVEDIVDLPKEGQGATIGSRPQLECHRTSKDYLQTLQTNTTYRYETGFHPEAYIALAITRLRENGIVLDKDTYSFLTGAYFPSSVFVPGACFHPSYLRARLGGDGPVALATALRVSG